MQYCHTYNKILVTGSNGQLGLSLKKQITNMGKLENYCFVDIDELDITNANAIRSFVEKNKIELILNCAAYTAVDKAETDKKQAELVNTNASAYLAGICKEFDLPLIHTSTDFIFDGENSIPYTESDKTNPLSIYGLTKLNGEKEVLKRADSFIIIRTSWLYSEYGKNFVKTMLALSKDKKELSIIYDQIGTPTYAGDLAAAIIAIIPSMSKGVKQIYHYSNEGVASWYDFAKSIFEISNIDIKVNPIETKEYPTPAKRPKYSVLNKAKIKKDYKLEIPYWRDSLRKCLKNMSEA